MLAYDGRLYPRHRPPVSTVYYFCAKQVAKDCPSSYLDLQTVPPTDFGAEHYINHVRKVKLPGAAPFDKGEGARVVKVPLTRI
jgi:hypothetical protein